MLDVRVTCLGSLDHLLLRSGLGEVVCCLDVPRLGGTHDHQRPLGVDLPRRPLRCALQVAQEIDAPLVEHAAVRADHAEAESRVSAHRWP